VSEVTFDGLRSAGRGARVRIQEGNHIIDGEFLGIVPGKPSGTNREKQDAAVVRSGALIAYVRERDVHTIKLDKRTGKRRRR
jgi:hypothetical protein